jgi:hypothetical protein
MNTRYTLSEVEAILIEINMILERDNKTNYNNLMLELRYYTKLAKSLKAGA